MASTDLGILCVLISDRDGQLLTEHLRQRGAAVGQNAKKVLATVPKAKAEKRSYVYNNLCYNMLSDATGTLFLAVTDETFSRAHCFVFLDEVRKQFGNSGRNVGTFLPTLRKLTDDYSNPASDKLQNLKKNIDEVKGVMIENIDRILERGEKIDLLVDKTETLERRADTFRSNATELKRKMWWKNFMMKVAIVVVILVVIFLVTLFACSEGGVNFYKCGQKRPADPTPKPPTPPPTPTPPTPQPTPEPTPHPPTPSP